MMRSHLRLLGLVPIALLSAAACGGSAFEGRGSGGGASAGAGSGVAGHASAGSPSSAGSPGSGGAANSAGAPSSGGAPSGAGSTHSGGSGNVGNTGGSVGSAGSGGADLRACTSNTDCKLVAASCCSCGLGPVSNFTAINAKFQSQYALRCGGLLCVACPPIVPNPNDPVLYYVPTCQAGHCTVVDLAATDVTACQTAQDCALRSGTECCSGCAGSAVAINASRQSELSQLVCGTEPFACPACAPNFSGESATCSDGRCSVVLDQCSGPTPCL